MAMQQYSGLVAFLCFSGFVHSQTHADVKSLKNYLFDHYDPRIRPIQDKTQTILLDISMFLFSINDVDEVNKKLMSTGYLEVSWVDELLQWSMDLWNNTDYLNVPQVYFFHVCTVEKGRSFEHQF